MTKEQAKEIILEISKAQAKIQKSREKTEIELENAAFNLEHTDYDDPEIRNLYYSEDKQIQDQRLLHRSMRNLINLLNQEYFLSSLMKSVGESLN